MRCVHFHREKSFSLNIYVWHVLFPEREYASERIERERRDTYNTIIMEQETDGRWQTFLISRVHDKLLLMSDSEKKKSFSLRVYVN
jgi:hypothetical protein